MATYAPGMQAEYMARHHDRCFSGAAPTLRRYADVHGKDSVKMWLSTQIKDLCEFAGAKKPLPDAMEDIAATIIAQYPGLKLTELMVFMQLFKAGHYGHFYGTFDPLVLTASLREFCEGYRQREHARIAREEERQARERYNASAITLDEAVEAGLCPNIQALLAKHRSGRARI